MTRVAAWRGSCWARRGGTVHLYHTPDRKRWFLIPNGTPLPPGTLQVRRYGGPARAVDEAITAHEVDEARARAWIDARLRTSFARVGEAFRKVLAALVGARPASPPTSPPAAARRPGGAPRKLARVGFFAELRHGDPSGARLADARRAQAHPDEPALVAYLQGAPVLIAAPGPVRDVVDPGVGFVGTPSIHTDGTWAWPGDLAHYVARYHAALPEAFVAHARARRFRHAPFDVTAVRF